MFNLVVNDSILCCSMICRVHRVWIIDHFDQRIFQGHIVVRIELHTTKIRYGIRFGSGSRYLISVSPIISGTRDLPTVPVSRGTVFGYGFSR